MANDRLARMLAVIQKQFGKEHALRVDDEHVAASQVREVIPTGLEVVDRHALGLGGLPIGRISELAGEEGAGKSGFMYALLAAAQRVGATAVLVDAEQSFDVDRVRVMGADPAELLVLQPLHLEMAIEQIKTVVRSNRPAGGAMLIAWDTLAATIPERFRNQEVGDARVGEVARIMSQELPKILPLLLAHRAHLLVGNQLREKIGVIFGDSKYTPGGKALKFYASWRAQFFGGKAIKNPTTNEHTGKILTLLVTKTRFTVPFRKVRLRLDYATGWNDHWCTLEHAKTQGVFRPRVDGSYCAGSLGDAAWTLARERLGWVPGVMAAERPAKDAENSDEDREDHGAPDLADEGD